MTENEIASIIVDTAFRIHCDWDLDCLKASTRGSWKLN